MEIISGAGQFTPPAAGEGTHWAEQLRVADLSVGTYSIRRGGRDDQEPHTEDEIYLVTAGHARLVAGGQSSPASPGSVLFVPAGQVHQFTDVTEDFAVVVVFGPAEGSRDAG